MTELKLGYKGPLYDPWYDWAWRKYSQLRALLGNNDDYFGSDEQRWVFALQRNLGIVQDGIFGDRTAAAAGYTWPGASAPPVVKPRRKIWIYTNPGSGANFDQGPSFQLGVRCKDVLNINHQPVYFQKGGYLGFMGGDGKFSYNEVIFDQYKSLEYLLDHNPDAIEALRLAEQICIQKQWHPEETNDTQLIEIARLLEFEWHASGYSQSADGLEEALEILLGDGGHIHPGDPTETPSDPGKYRLIRHCLKLVVQFGNPSTKGTGIARKTRSTWLDRKIRNVNYDNDFYAKVPASDKIRPPMYAIIVDAETELPFFVRVLRLAVPIITEWAMLALPIIGPLLGGFGPMAQLGLGMIGGLQGLGNNPLLGGFMGMAAADTDTEIDEKIIALLKPTGVLTNIPGLIGLIAALPGLQAHGGYEFDPAKMNQAFDHIAGFRR